MILAVINLSEAWPIIATVVGIVSSAISTSVWFSMNGMKESNKTTAENSAQGIREAARKQDEANKEISLIKERIATCRQECDESHASKEDHNREAGYTRRFQEMQIAAMAKIEAKLDIMQQLPATAGQVAKAVVEAMKRGE
jgi:hypothetical protein